jgi:hypothetical protein
VFRLGVVRTGYARLGQIKSLLARLGQVRLGYSRPCKFKLVQLDHVKPG